ncbi:Tat proofreading chaperone DmsD [Aggregatibacter actinomycetemcomitans]|uniref:Tat proofreading chaperone DmsD n=1 Tax=Aggregatibacter actinomycetemcomitans TaxID=714 RepID=UPI001E3AE5E5|nr:Tat proofreading chaperone DmsD [Aggregatibacter actinomycetemcomitans]
MDNGLMQWISTTGRLLGAAFYYAPDDARVASVLCFFERENWQQEWAPFVDEKTLEKTTALFAEGLQQPLAEQYQALFIGPNALPAPPWGSVYLDPESVIFGSSLLELRAFLQRHQIAFQSHQNEPEDHLGLMLMLAAYLAENQPHLMREFLNRHFLTWAPHCLQLLAALEDFLFYRGLALLTLATLKQWQQALNLEVPIVRFYR